MILQTILKDAAPVILKSAPLLGAALGGPISGVVLSVIANAFGVDPDNTSTLVQKILSDLPNAQKILKETESKHADSLIGINDVKMPTSVEINVKMTWQDKINGI